MIPAVSGRIKAPCLATRYLEVAAVTFGVGVIRFLVVNYNAALLCTDGNVAITTGERWVSAVGVFCLILTRLQSLRNPK